MVSALFVSGLAAGERSAYADYAYDREEIEFLQLINEYRTNNGLNSLLLSYTLTVASEKHSEDMGQYDFFAHETVKSSYYPVGSRHVQRVAAEGYNYNTYTGENLAGGYETAEAAFEAWRLSPGHNANMLGSSYRVIGIARVHVPDSTYKWYWTTEFGGEVDPSAHRPGEPSPGNRDRAENPQRSGAERAGYSSPSRKRGEEVRQDAIEGGTMNDGARWDQRSATGLDLVTGVRISRLGGYDQARDDLSQSVSIGEGQRLVFDLLTTTRDGARSPDRMVVRVKDEAGRVVPLRTYTAAGAGDGEWRRQSLDLARFSGQTVTLSFYARTDGGRPTTFYLDNVSLER